VADDFTRQPSRRAALAILPMEQNGTKWNIFRYHQRGFVCILRFPAWDRIAGFTASSASKIIEP